MAEVFLPGWFPLPTHATKGEVEPWNVYFSQTDLSLYHLSLREKRGRGTGTCLIGKNSTRIQVMPPFQ